MVAVSGCLVMVVSLVFSTFVQKLVACEILLARQLEPLGNVLRSENWTAVKSTSMSYLGLHHEGRELTSAQRFYQRFRWLVHCITASSAATYNQLRLPAHRATAHGRGRRP